MMGALRALGAGAVFACAVAVGPASADKLEISPRVYENYQDYLKEISGFNVAVFAVAQDGDSSFYVYCDENCSLSSLARQAEETCERRAELPCKIMAVNKDLRIEFEVANPIADLPSDSAILAQRLSAADLKSRIVGNTMRGEYPNHVAWAEYYDPSGELRGRDARKGAYTARYALKGDQLCYDYEGSDDDWCAQVSDVGGEVSLVTDGKLVTYNRNLSIVPGNPDNL